MGTDLTVVNAARVSFNKQSEWELVSAGPDQYGHYLEEVLSDKDKKLVNYLAKHNHFTPFTHCSATFHIKVPIFVARQLHKHQVGFTVNEVSRRYVDSEPEFYFPDVWRKKAENVKQGSSDEAVYLGWECDLPAMIVSSTLDLYKQLLNKGVCAEQARMVLPLNTMTEFWMTGSLYGWARMCTLRLDSHAQKEIRDVAEMISKEMRQLFPESWKALLNE